MKNEEFKEKIDQVLRPLNYKKKGNKWIIQTEDLTKIIELQKSGYSNLYYINFGISFNRLDYNAVAPHVFSRHANIFDLETASDDIVDRLLVESLNLITEIFERLITFNDALGYIETLPSLNMLPLRVKEFLNLK